MLMRLVCPCLTVAIAFFLTGCADLTVPITRSVQLMMPKPADPPATIEARGRLQRLLQRSLAMESVVQARRTQLDECDITAPTAPTARIDRPGQALRVDLLGESDPVSIKAGA